MLHLLASVFLSQRQCSVPEVKMPDHKHDALYQLLGGDRALANGNHVLTGMRDMSTHPSMLGHSREEYIWEEQVFPRQLNLQLLIL